MTFEIKQFYSNKSILISGCTGYLAKIILEKIIRTCSDFKRIYVLMRVKQGVSLQDRLQNEVLNSLIFTMLYEARPELRAVVRERVIAVQGDLSIENLGMDPVVRSEIIEELDIIINSAASINFRDHLLDALKTNYYGATRILDLAHQCKHLQVLSHVSTAYVGSNYPSMSMMYETIPKDIHKDDWEVQIKNLLVMDREEITKNEEKLINGYHNTYTYTKNLAERHLQRYRGNLRIVINRPSGIIHCTKEPVPGWIDTVSAVGVVAFPVGMGMSRTVFVPDGNLDFIPGDYVSNGILATTAYSASLPEPTFTIYHNSSLTSNPFRVYEFWKYAVEYLKYNPFEKQIREPRWYPLDTQKKYETLVYIQDDLPAKITEFFAKLPIIGSKSTLEQVKKFQKMRGIVENLQEDIDYFKCHYWFYDCRELLKVSSKMDPKEADQFEFDPRKVDFPREGARMLYGIQRYYLNQDVPLAGSGIRGILQMNHFNWAHDLRFSLQANKIIKQKDLKSLHTEILNPVKFQQFLSLVYAQNNKRDNKVLVGGLFPTQSPGTIIQMNQQHAFQQLKQLDTAVNKKAWPPLLMYVNKTFRNAFEGIFINDPGLDNVKTLLAKKEKVVLVPIYKSFLDLSLLLYSLFVNEIDFPFSIGNMEDVPSVALIDSVLSNSGYISAKRSRDQSLQQSYINQALLREIINKHPMTILFQNDIRLRSGKLTQPVVADLGILWLMQAYLTSMQKEGKTVHLIPVAINYERVFEVRNLATEMVSGKVPRLSLIQLLNMIGSEKQGKLGRVFVNFGQSINLREYLQNVSIPVVNYENIDEASLRLSEKLYKEQQHTNSVNLSQVVAVLLLQETGQRIGLRTLLANCIKVQQYLKKRKVNSVMTLDATLFSVTNVVKKLGFKIQRLSQQPKGRNNEMEVLLDAKEDQKNVLGLSYYSNALMQSLIMDCCVGYLFTKHSESPQTRDQPLALSKVEEDVKTLYTILRYEFIEKLRQRPLPESVNIRVKLLESLGVISIKDGAVEIIQPAAKSTKKDKNKILSEPFSFIRFFYKMGLYMMDTYLIVLMAVQEICNGNYEVREENLITELHTAIITMHEQSLVSQLQSCLKETIRTALARYVKLGLINSKSHVSQNGSRTTFVQSPISNKPKIEDITNKLLEFKGLSADELSIWGERISKAVESSLVVFMSVGKL